jgi:nicotinamide-nucleotide amidase
MKVHILTVGDEILIGQVIDTNSAWLGQQLNLIGAEIVEITSVGDTHAAICGGLGHALSNADLVIMTGGLGPTRDDITKRAIADYFGVEMVFDEPTYERIVRMFQMLGRPTTENHRLQCYMPANAQLLKNKLGTAPGMWFDLGKQVLVSLPGVPYEMKWIFENELIVRLSAKFPGSPIAHRTILTAGVGESQLAAMLEKFEDNLPPEIKMAYLPSLGQVRLRLTGRGTDADALRTVLDQQQAALLRIVGQHVFGFGSDTLSGKIGELLHSKKLTICTAESCTGGYLAHLIASVPGSSAYFHGSIIAYANEVKQHLLGVPAEILTSHGAVSEQTVKAMVTGGLAATRSDIAVATSGIAGPDGGTAEKPVGTIWVAVGNASRCEATKLQLGKDRLKNIEYTAIFSLEMTRKFLFESYPDTPD